MGTGGSHPPLSGLLGKKLTGISSSNYDANKLEVECLELEFEDGIKVRFEADPIYLTVSQHPREDA